jgi:hypothetical protein
MVDGRLRLAAPRLETIRRSLDGHAFVADIEPGDVVSIHWDWACDRLEPGQLGRLQSWTRRELEVANRTM